MESPRIDWRPWIVDAILASGLLGFSVVVRLGVLEGAVVSGDDLWPCLEAFQLLHGGESVPRDYLHFGPALTWLHLPVVAGASSVVSLYIRRLAIQALMGPAIYLCLRGMLAGGATVPPSRRWMARLAALAAAVGVSFSPGLLSSLRSFHELYMAPELAAIVGLALLAVLRGGARWLILAFALVALLGMVHPFTICLAPGLLAVTVLVWRRGRRRLALGATAVGAALFAPMASQLWRSLDQFRGGPALREMVPGGETSSSMLIQRVVVDSVNGVLHQELVPFGLLMLLAPAVATGIGVAALAGGRRWPALNTARPFLVVLAWFAGVTLAAQLTLVAAGLLLGYLQPYHWRLLLPAQAIVLGLLLFGGAVAVESWLAHRLPKRPFAAPVGALLAAVLLLVPASSTLRAYGGRLTVGGDLAALRWLSSVVAEDAAGEGRWFEMASLGLENPWGYATALYLEQRLSGVPQEAVTLDGALFLVFTAPRASAAELDAALGWNVSAEQEPRSNWAGESLESPDHPGIQLVALDRGFPPPAKMVIRLADPQAARRFADLLKRQYGSHATVCLMESAEYLGMNEAGFQRATLEPWLDHICRSGPHLNMPPR